MNKTSGKKVKGWIIIRNGKMGVRLDAGQELGTSCHRINDILLPGTAVDRKTWEDDPKIPDDLEFDRRQVQR